MMMIDVCLVFFFPFQVKVFLLEKHLQDVPLVRACLKKVKSKGQAERGAVPSCATGCQSLTEDSSAGPEGFLVLPGNGRIEDLEDSKMLVEVKDTRRHFGLI